MNINTVMRVVLEIATLVTWLLLAAGLVWSIFFKIPIMIVVCFLLVLGFGLFVYKDYKYYFGKK